MRKLMVSAMLLLVAVAPASARVRAVRKPGGPAATDAYLEAALQAAAWLESIERKSGADLGSWPIADSFAVYNPGVDNGAAGVGFFFLRLYDVTGDRHYLDVAKRAANYVANEYKGARRMNGHDWLSGASGGGSFLVAVHRATGDARYLDAARGAGDWLLSTAIATAAGLHWQHATVEKTYTGLAHGASGVGIFLLDLYEASGDARYLDAARRAWNWVETYEIPTAHGFVFKRLITDTVSYPGWCGGTTGIVYFLERLDRVTGEPRYREALLRAADGLIDTAVPRAGGGVAWDHYGPNSGNGIVYCHGATSATSALAAAYRLSGDSRYLEAARKGAQWVSSRAVAEPRGLSWYQFDRSPYHESGLLTGTASVGHAYLRLWSAERDAAQLESARQAGEYLLGLADRPAPGQLRWINYTNPPQTGSDPLRYESGWYSGAAGIGLFLLELHDALHGRAIADVFSGMHP
ncbi:MAG TPA: lanthionine synthetase LanC family protein [Thermoanaerobaculia bacterium]|jgi:hypothetical protein